MKHIDEISLELYIFGSKESGFSPDEIESHLAVCASCRELHATISKFHSELSREMTDESETGTALPVPSPRGIRRSPGPTPAAHDSRAIGLREVEIALPLRIARWIVHYPVRTTIGTAGGVALIAALLWFTPRQGTPPLSILNPVDFELTGQIVKFVNAYGEVLREMEVSPGQADELVQDHQTSTRRIQFADITGDNINEIFIAFTAPSDLGTVGGVVVCQSADGQTEYWRHSTARHFNFPKKPEGDTPEFPIRTINVGDHNGDGKQELYVLTAHSQFPSYVAKLDAATGELTGQYLHVGHMVNMKIADIDGDDIGEIVLAGVNNAYNEACVIVLDTRHMDGYGPVREAYIPEDLAPAREKVYALIPRTIVGEAIRDDGTTMHAREVQILKESKSVKVDIQEYNRRQEMGSYSVWFDYHLAPKNYGTGGDFDALAARLFLAGRIDRETDAEYFREFLGSIRYWDGEMWQSHPVVNRVVPVPEPGVPDSGTR